MKEKEIEQGQEEGEERMRELAKPMLKNQYGQYLLKVIEEVKNPVNSETFRQ